MQVFSKALITCITLTLSGPLVAQMEIGGVVDFNITGFNVQPGGTGETYASYLGLGIGVVVDYPLTERIDLHVEPMVLQKGGKISEDGFSWKYKITYLEFPVMVRYTIPLDGMVMPYVMAGPNAGLRGNARLISRNGTPVDDTENIRFFDLGVGLGGGAIMPLDNKRLFAEARYVLGLVNINREADESTVKNRGLQVLLGITFPFGR